MRIEVSQQLRLAQEMRLSPRIIQAMEILQLPILALQERIESELQSNPVLELHELESGPEPPAAEPPERDRGEETMVVREDGGHAEDFGRLDEFAEEYGADAAWDVPRRAAASDGERDRKMDAMANAPAPAQSLTDYLLEQWAFLEAAPAVRSAGEVLIAYISPDGYLRTPLEEIANPSLAAPIAGEPAATGPAAEASPADAAAAEAPAAEAPAAEAPAVAIPAVVAEEDEAAAPPALVDLEAALQLVQTLDPIGVGARDLRECLLLQLAAEEAAGADVALERELVENHLADIETHRLPLIARRVKKGVEEVQRAIESLSRLNPRPGLLVGAGSAPVIRPDAFVDIDEKGQLVITMPEANTPRLYISGTYRKMLRLRKADTQTRDYLRRNIRSAEWLIDAIRQRQNTIRRVVEEVFAAQRDFLDHGEEALRPLPMSDVARKVGVHVATVSRAVSGKYVQTPRGIYPLRMFFASGTRSESGGELAWDAVKVKLKEVVDAEDKHHPLDDDALVTEMQKQGITIARRTIAKYRTMLGIPPARRRRQY